MCGIAGEINFRGIETDESIFEQMINSLKNRGPNQQGMLNLDKVVLLHTRLAVIDAEKGIQPMTFAKNNEEIFHIVYNGEIYNTAEVKEKLKHLGYSFAGYSDTEVLLKAYAEWGPQSLDLINGIFAFAIWHQHDNLLFFARDRLGVKPFFYTEKNGSFIFASEIKTLLKHPIVSSNIDLNSIAEIILLGPGRTPGSGVFRDIKELRPGFFGFVNASKVKTEKYWQLTDKEHNDTFEQTLEKVRFLLIDAIEKQLISDVPICAFLSGGLDSSIIAAIAANSLNKKGERLNTFSVDYYHNEKYFQKNKFQHNTDRYYIQQMCEHLSINHTTVMLNSQDVADALFEAVEARDLPGMADVDSSLLLFCRNVKAKATVALSGECADEIFGGYPWYKNASIKKNKGFPWMKTTKFRHSFLLKQFADLINPEEYIDKKYLQTIREVSKTPNLSDLESTMKEMIKLNFDWFMQTLLDRKDRMSMRSGLEVRVPFCDHRMVEYLYAVPWSMKNYKEREKGLLRQAVADLLPNRVLWRLKNPYPTTHDPIYLQTVSKLLTEVIADSESPLLKIVKKSSLEKLLAAGTPDVWYGQLMNSAQTIAYFLQINYWLQKYKVKIV